jgi:hypothetical protein
MSRAPHESISLQDGSETGTGTGIPLDLIHGTSRLIQSHTQVSRLS